MTQHTIRTSLKDLVFLMPSRKAFALQISQDVLAGMQRWAGDSLRSLNAQIEFVLPAALRSTGRAVKEGRETHEAGKG